MKAVADYKRKNAFPIYNENSSVNTKYSRSLEDLINTNLLYLVTYTYSIFYKLLL